MYANSDNVTELLNKFGSDQEIQEDLEQECAVEGYPRGIVVEHGTLIFYLVDKDEPKKGIQILAKDFVNLMRSNKDSVKGESLLKMIQEQRLAVLVKGFYSPLKNIIEPSEIICGDSYVLHLLQKNESGVRVDYNPDYVADFLEEYAK